MIADNSFALVGIDVEPNEAFVFPFVRERFLRYRQQFLLYDRTFWMPADIRVEGRFRVNLLGFSIPPIGIEQTSVMYRYGINIPVPDSVFRKPRDTIDSAATKMDTSFWASTQVLPLNAEEQKAYSGLDSTQRLEVQFRPGGVGMTLGMGAEGAASFLQYLALVDSLPPDVRRICVFAGINAVERLAWTQFEMHLGCLHRPEDVALLESVMAEEKFHLNYVEAELEQQSKGEHAAVVTAAVEESRQRFAQFSEKRRAETRAAVERMLGGGQA